jgi:hypothetical protein
MSVAEVMQYAKDKGIRLPGAKSRDPVTNEMLDVVSVRFTERQIVEINRLARSMNMSRAEFLRGAMINALNLPRAHSNDGEPPRGIKGQA